jgi:hypothetical protein
MQIIRKEDKNIMLIHNLRNVKTKEQLETVIKRDILDVFENPIEEVDERTGCVYYRSKGIIHFLFAEDGSEAGNLRNEPTKEKILNMISNIGLEPMPINEFWPRMEHAL